MMLERLASLLAGKPAISDWKILELAERRHEAFLSGRDVEMARAVETRRWSVTVYVDFRDRDAASGGVDLRGDATIQVHPGMDEDELSSLVDRAVLAAGRARNPRFTVADPDGQEPAALDSAFDGPVPGEPNRGPASGAGSGAEDGRESGEGLESWVEKLLSELRGVDVVPTSRYASLELFLGSSDRRFLNSRGLRREGRVWNGHLEFAACASGGDREVELYRGENFSDYEAGALASVAERRFREAADRLSAAPLPALRVPVLFSGQDLGTLFGYWLAQLSAESVYRKASRAELGAPLQALGAGDRISLTLDPTLTGAPGRRPFDSDGVLPRRAELLRDGVAVGLRAPLRWSQYLGVPLTGEGRCSVFAGGSKSSEELRAGRCLEPAAFSDFYLDPISGDFGGEIRLAYLWENGVPTPYAGGSLSGNIADASGTLVLSRERERIGDLYLPSCVLVEGCSVTGAD